MTNLVADGSLDRRGEKHQDQQLPAMATAATATSTPGDGGASILTTRRNDEAWWSIHPFRGMINDIRRRAPYYVSDWLDAWDYRVVPATVFMYFAKYAMNHPFSSPLCFLSCPKDCIKQTSEHMLTFLCYEQHPTCSCFLARHVPEYGIQLRCQRSSTGFCSRLRCLFHIFCPTTRHCWSNWYVMLYISMFLS